MRLPSALSWAILLTPVGVLVGGLSALGLAPDAARLGALFLPGVLLAWLAATRSWRFLWPLVLLWCFVFALDAALRGACWAVYGSELDSPFILEALANTSRQEVWEYVVQYLWAWPLILLAALSPGLWLFGLRRRLQPVDRSWRSGGAALLIFLTLLMTLSYAIRPSRDLFPVVYWMHYLQEIQSFDEVMAGAAQRMRTWEAQAQTENLRVLAPERRTVVLILGESITALNWSLCGYPRPTNPQLASWRDQITLFCYAQSPAATTISALNYLLTDSTLADPSGEARGNVLARAHAAGYHRTWISNQSDDYTATLYGDTLEAATFVNRRAGRNSSSMDEAVLPAFAAALADPAPRQFIVVHLLGAHPTYSMRYPDGQRQFVEDTPDAVTAALNAAGRSLLTRVRRAEYDNAVRYHDQVLTRLLATAAATAARDGRSMTVVYASDHGQEVGHESNHAGHSPNTASGYAIPVWFWHSDRARQPEVEDRPIVADTLDIQLQRLLGIQNVSGEDWFAPTYQPPERRPCC